MIARSVARTTARRLIDRLTGDGSGISAPAFSLQPTSRTVTDGQEVTLTSLASGNPTYQWQISTNDGSDWSNIADANSASYTFTADIANTGDQYRVIATNSEGSATSDAATVTIVDIADVITFDSTTVTFDSTTAFTFDQALV